MKFAKELEQDLVPEWRVKYLNYKAGKKHVKAVAKAAARMNATPRNPPTPAALQPRRGYGGTSFTPRIYPASTLVRSDRDLGDAESEPITATPAPLGSNSRPVSGESLANSSTPTKKTSPMDISRGKPPPPSESGARYGSFVPTPPTKEPHPFELPAPAMAPDSGCHTTRPITPTGNARPPHLRTSSATMPNAYEVGPTTPPPKSNFASIRERMAHRQKPGASLRRMFTSSGTPEAANEPRRIDTDMVALDYVRTKQMEFFKWMDKELAKIEGFYKSKEDEAGARLDVLRDQLHEMRNRRLEEIAIAQHAKQHCKDGKDADELNSGDTNLGQSNGNADSKKNGQSSERNPGDNLTSWLNPVGRVIDGARAKAFEATAGPNTKALQKMRRSPETRFGNQTEQNQAADQSRDYVRRPHYADEVPYRTAKRKLKLALQELYRSMELLKSYALLNRTAFRKINKKYDKAIDAHPPLRYMSEKVSKAWFVQSEVLDGHLHAVEDLYARYFERGNHKVAVGKLRSASGKHGDQSASAFQNGIFIGTGAVFGIQGIIYGRDLLLHPDPTIVTQTSYLLQIYGGYFLALYLFYWFCLDCSVWAKSRINYTFVFEFDPRHDLGWRQLTEFPSLLILILGLFLWVNFTRYGSPDMYIYFPVILIFVSIIIIFFPGPVLYHRSRKWFVYSHWRLLLAGLYPVEFRDFFLGDMYCSLTYFTANIELFFCLYANYWNNPAQCNSTHSRLLGFFTALPAIWRTLQCLRRYYDTRNVFPHLVNCGKYGMTILYCVTLSMYRIHQTNGHLALFSTFATVSSIYSSVWDILMDWSLLQPHASKRMLRDVRGFKSTWWYYGAMMIDPILRFNWIFYSLFTHDLQHSTLVSFLVAFSEVTRRGIWTLFRVENEHCSNVARFKASRDVPLPYSTRASYEADFQRQETIPENEPVRIPSSISRPRSHTGTALEAQDSHGSSSIRRRPGPIRTFTRVLADAHTQDFEKKRKPGVNDSDSLSNHKRDSQNEGRAAGSSDEDDDDDDENDAEDLLDAEQLIRERTRGFD